MHWVVVGGRRLGLRAAKPSFLQTTASLPTISIIHCPPTCLLMPAVARLPRAQDENLGGALEPLPLERPPLLRKGRKMRMKPVKLKGSELPHNNHRPLLHPLQFRSVVPRPQEGAVSRVLAWPYLSFHMGSCCSSFSKRMKVQKGRQREPAHLPLHRRPTRRQLPGPAKGHRQGKYTILRVSQVDVPSLEQGGGVTDGRA